MDGPKKASLSQKGEYSGKSLTSKEKGKYERVKNIGGQLHSLVGR